MNLENTWYVIERKNRYEVVSHSSLSELAAESYVMLQNFDTHLEALSEFHRLIKLEIEDTRHKLNGGS
jgi:TRAP-type C4-dicarboxylate transport system substrate-binding protein